MSHKIYFVLFTALLMLGLVAALLFYSVPIAHAATITVTTLSETSSVGQCTLRNAITAANTDAAVFGCTAGSGADTISFAALSGTIVLTGTLPAINSDLTIDGSDNITISGNDLFQVLAVSSGKFNLNNITIQKGKGATSGGALVNGSNGTVTISNTNFLSNTAPVANADGGAIVNSGTTAILHIWNSTFRANVSSDQGGAIYVSNGNVSITGTTFISNTASALGGLGGAITQASGAVTITTSTFSLNRSSSDGGAIATFSTIGGLRVTNSTFDNNATTSNGSGGAIGNAGNTTVVTITTSSFSNNSAAAAGGAVSIFGRVTISNSSFLNNQSFATNGNGGGGIFIVTPSSITSTISNSSLTGNSADLGGGIHVGLGKVAITNTTLSGNTALRDGGGLASTGTTTTTLNNVTVAFNTADNDSNTTGNGGGVFRSSGTLNVKNTIIANNTDTGGQAPDCGGTLVSLGNNFLGLATGCSGLTDGVNSDHVANPADPLLLTLGYYGGSTLVHAFQATSAALNNGNNATCASTDQRGVPRPIGGTCDIGAFEGGGYINYLPLIRK